MLSVKDLIKLRPIKRKTAEMLVYKYHYARKVPGTARLFLGVYWENMLEGVIIFGCIVGKNVINLVRDTKKDEFLELMRLALSPRLPKNSESRVIAVSLKLLKKHYPKLKWVVSYADKNQKHLGRIYQATNWVYTGEGGVDEIFIKNGREYHQRTISHWFRLLGQSAEKSGFEVKKLLGKHRYFYFLQPDIKEKLRLKILPYPKEEV